jgi:cation-transporting ATPase 13A3/4/5
MCFFGSWPLLGYKRGAQAMFTVWVIFICWFSFLLMVRPHLRNWFRAPTSLAKADVLLIEAQNPTAQSVSVFPSLGVRLLRPLLIYGSDGMAPKFSRKTVKVETTEDKCRHVTYRCSRLIFSEGTFRSKQPDLGASLEEMRSNTTGLTTPEAHARLNMVGRNTIPFSVPPLGEAISWDFSQAFYVYQLMVRCVVHYLIAFARACHVSLSCLGLQYLDVVCTHT